VKCAIGLAKHKWVSRGEHVREFDSASVYVLLDCTSCGCIKKISCSDDDQLRLIGVKYYDSKFNEVGDIG